MAKQDPNDLAFLVIAILAFLACIFIMFFIGALGAFLEDRGIKEPNVQKIQRL